MAAATNHAFYRSFLRLSAVNVLSNLMVPLAGLMDVAFLGHLDEIRHLSGVALATVLFNYIYWTFGFLRMGTTGTTAQAVGRGDRAGVWLVALRSGMMAIAISIAILLLHVPLREMGFALMSATPDVKVAGVDYFNALIWGAPATLLNFVLLGWFLGRGQGGKVLLLSVVNNLCTVGLDYWMIVRWGWASAGAGWSTALAQSITLVVGLELMAREVDWVQIRAIAPQLFDRKALTTIFTLNGDILIRTFALLTAFALFTNFSSSLGTVLLVTNTLLLQVVSLSAYFIDGFAFATESIAGTLHGRGEGDRLRQLLLISGGSSLFLGLLFALGFVLFPQRFFPLLTNHTPVLNTISQYVLWLVPVLGFGSIAYMLDGYFLGLTEGRILRWSSLVATLVGFMPVAIAALRMQNPHWLWFALTLFMAARAMTLLVCVPHTLQRP